MCNYILTHCNCIVIDLKHHHQYTFGNGNVIRDYIFDTLALRKFIHIYLNPIFTNKSIIKIFIIWNDFYHCHTFNKYGNIIYH